MRRWNMKRWLLTRRKKLLLGSVLCVVAILYAKQGYDIWTGVSSAWAKYQVWSADREVARRAKAVADAKIDYDGWFTWHSTQERLLPQIVDYEAREGHTAEMQRWVCRGIDDRMNVRYTEQAAVDFLAEEVERRIAEGARQKAEREAEAARKAAEWEADRPAREAKEAKERAEREAREAERAKRDRERNPCTAENFNRIRVGMTYDQVAAFMGPYGKTQSQASGGGITLTVITWSNDGFFDIRNIVVMFENGRVTAKSQLGL
jgi:hypothetical protein